MDPVSAIASTIAGSTLTAGDTAFLAAAGASDAAASSASLLGDIWGGVKAAGTALAAVSPILSGYAQSRSASYQAQVAANNARIATQNATTALQQGTSEQQQQQMKTAALVGAQMAAQAGSGVDVNTGSALDVRSSARALGELSVLDIGYNARTRANAFLSQAQSETAQGQIYRSESRSDLLSGFLSPGASLIGAMRSVAPKWYSLFGGET